MKKTNESVYRCDFCNKAIISAGFMKLHERMCKKNPKNQHQCFKYCKFLIRGTNNIFNEEGYTTGYTTSFSCAKRPGIELYSFKLERYKVNQGWIKDMERMPLECEFYECEHGHDFSEPIDCLDELNSEFKFI